MCCPVSPVATDFDQEHGLDEQQLTRLLVNCRPESGQHRCPEQCAHNDHDNGGACQRDEIVDDEMDKIGGPASSEHPLGSQSERPLQRNERRRRHHHPERERRAESESTHEDGCSGHA